MRLSFGLVLSILFHVGFIAYAMFWSPGGSPRVSVDKPVYTVDLLSLAPPPPPRPAPVIEAPAEVAQEPPVPVVEAAPEPEIAVEAAPIVEARQEPKPEPKVEKISEKKVEKKTIVKKEEPKAESKSKSKPKSKPKKTADQLRKEALAAAQAQVKRQSKQQEAAKAKALRDELAALKRGLPGGVEGGIEGGKAGASGSGLSEVYALIVGMAIKQNWRYPSFAGEANLVATVEINLDADGKILGSKVLASSGNVEFDSSTLRAIKETEYVERPRTDRDRVLLINFNSQELSE